MKKIYLYILIIIGITLIGPSVIGDVIGNNYFLIKWYGIFGETTAIDRFIGKFAWWSLIIIGLGICFIAISLISLYKNKDSAKWGILGTLILIVSFISNFTNYRSLIIEWEFYTLFPAHFGISFYFSIGMLSIFTVSYFIIALDEFTNLDFIRP